MMFDGYGYGGPGFFGMGFGMLLFWGLLVVGLVVLVRWLAGTGSNRRDTDPSPNATALEILAQRYARGEIDRTEYEQKRRDLGGG